MSVGLTIVEEMQKIATEQNRKLAKLEPGTPLLESGLDSLCFAILIARLEDRFGFDPFSAADEVDFPVDFQDLVSLYDKLPA